MVTKELVMKDFTRMDASPAAMLVQLASKFDSSVYVDQAEKRTNETPRRKKSRGCRWYENISAD